MLSRRTMHGPLTGAFQMPVWTVLPCQETSRGRPTLTESKRPITFPNNDYCNLEVNPPRAHSTFGRSRSYQRMSGLCHRTVKGGLCCHFGDTGHSSVDMIEDRKSTR